MAEATGTEVAVIEQSSALGGLFDPDAEGALTQSERALISGLLSKNALAEVAIPDEISDENLWRTLGVCCKVSQRIGRVGTILKMFIGRALVLMQNRPEIFKERGFRSLPEFMTSDADNGLQKLTGMSRAGLYDALKMASTFPELSISEMAQIGTSKMQVITEFRKAGDSDLSKWAELAKNTTAKGLREAIYRSDNNIPNGSLELDSLILTVSKAEKEEIQEFLNNPQFQAYCKSALPGIMLTQAIAESVSEWQVQIRESEES